MSNKSATSISEAEQKEHERLINELADATDAAIEPNQREQRATFRLRAFQQKLALRYRLQGTDTLALTGGITRGDAKLDIAPAVAPVAAQSKNRGR